MNQYPLDILDVVEHPGQHFVDIRDAHDFLISRVSVISINDVSNIELKYRY